MSYRHPRVDNTSNARRCVMLENATRNLLTGIPCASGEHYRAFVRFARKHAGTSILDLGCGYGAYSGALMKEGLKCVGCDLNLNYLKKAAQQGLPVVNVDTTLPFADRSFDSVMLFEVVEHVTDIQGILKARLRFGRPIERQQTQPEDLGAHEGERCYLCAHALVRSRSFFRSGVV
jgi:2-polyprenyl-3-methyl-5-hydroxy-6-metoxy-1,4-benzoquinol methylase